MEIDFSRIIRVPNYFITTKIWTSKSNSYFLTMIWLWRLLLTYQIIFVVFAEDNISYFFAKKKKRKIFEEQTVVQREKSKKPVIILRYIFRN